MTDRTLTPRKTFKATLFNAFLWLAFNFSITAWIHRGFFSSVDNRLSLFTLDSVLRIPPMETLAFIAATLFCYLTFACLLFLTAWPLVRRKPLFLGYSWVHTLGLLLGIGTIALNHALFPNSGYPLRIDTSLLFPGTSKPLQLLLIVAISTIVVGIAVFYWTRRFLSLPPKNLIVIFSSTALLFVVIGTFQRQSYPADYSGSKPNIILIGIDSLRSDVFTGPQHIRTSMPSLKAFTENAVIFQDTLTPLARTFPAWISILTGSNPIRHGIRYNLMKQPSKQSDLYLSTQLKNLDYQTLFASDERRFSPIDRRFGFDFSAGPITGASDFLLGSLVDTPITNIWLSSPLGKYLFPHSYGNRAVAHSYEPQHFLNLLENELNKMDPSRPAFIAVHLCLPHWPYLKRDSQSKDRLQLYRSSLQSSDMMLEKILATLTRKNRKNNALLIVFSDHGEGFPELYPTMSTNQPIYSQGHGTNVFDTDQHQVMLAIQRYEKGNKTLSPNQVFAPASLIDIFPTIADLVNLPLTPAVEGWKLTPLLHTHDELPDRWKIRTRYFESGITLASLLDSKELLDKEKIVKEGMGFYHVTESGQLEFRDALIYELMREKERAAQRGSLILALRNPQTGLELFSTEKKQLVKFQPENIAHQKLRHDFCHHFERDIALYMDNFRECDDFLVARQTN